MPGPDVQQDGARGLRWLALAVAVAVALPPPLLAARATWQGLQDRAAAIATALAGTMARLQAAEPRLWRHGGAKATGRLLTGPAWHDVRSVEVRDCAGALLARPLPAAPAAAGRGRGPAAWAAIGPSGGWVRVELDGAPVAAAAALVAALALALGLTLGLALSWGPFAALRRAAALREAQVAAAVAQVRALGRASLAAVEAERGRIARDLHDDLGQSLTALRLQVDALHASNAAPGLARARDAIERAIDDLRRVVGDLRPAGLDDDELASALRADAARLEAALDIAVPVRTEGPALRDAVLAAALLRLVREAVHNAVRHGGAGEVAVRLVVDDERLTLTVVDAGEGFVPEAVAWRGLAGMRERIALLGGALEVTAAPGRGCRVAVTVPRVQPPPPDAG